MNKIYYRHGTMYSGKSTDLIKNYLSDKRSKDVVALKPKADVRDEDITSRLVNVSIPCIKFDKDETILSVLQEYFKKEQKLPRVIYIDEVQFCTKSQIRELHDISKYAPIMCYGLKNSFTGEIFPSISTLISLTEDVKEIKHSCCMCARKATHNLLVRNGIPIYSGDLINVEGENKEDRYYAVCREHFYEPML